MHFVGHIDFLLMRGHGKTVNAELQTGPLFLLILPIPEVAQPASLGAI